jgi:hypothetical protein
VVEASALALGKEVEVHDARDRNDNEESIDAGSNVALSRHALVLLGITNATLITIDTTVLDLCQESDNGLMQSKQQRA